MIAKKKSHDAPMGLNLYHITNVICDLRRSDVERVFLAHRDTKKGCTSKKYSARPQVLVH